MEIKRKKENPGFKNFLVNTVFGNIEGNKFENSSSNEKNKIPSAIYIPKDSNTQNRTK